MLVLISLSGSVADARTWTSADGKFQVEAEMVALQGNIVKIKDTKGRVIEVPLAKLSADDQAYARRTSQERKLEKQKEAERDTQQIAPTPSTTISGDPALLPIPVAPRPASALSAAPQTGSFKITTEEEGVSATLYAQLTLAFGGSIKPALAQSIQSGKTKWIGNTDGSSPNWMVYVPNEYDAKVPYGMMVFISAGDGGNIRADLRPIMDKHRLIWIGANGSGNKHETALRHGLAVRAVHEITSRYQIDKDRIYVTGFSGGGRVTSQVMIMNSDIFSGGMPLCGCNPYRTLKMPGKNLFYEPRVKRLDPRAFARAKVNSRFVFFTGDTDSNREQTQEIAKQYKSDGFRYVSYMQVPGMGHTTPPAEWFEKGVVMLDSPLAAAAETSLKKAASLEKRGLLGVAIQTYIGALAHLSGMGAKPEVEAKITELQAMYETDVAKLEGVFAAGDVVAAKTALASFRKTWGNNARDAARFQQAIEKHSRGTSGTN